MSGGGVTSGRHAPRTCEFSRGMVDSVGTCQPAAAACRSQARRRARPAYDAGVLGRFPADDAATRRVVPE